jgi:hypothetical protein
MGVQVPPRALVFIMVQGLCDLVAEFREVAEKWPHFDKYLALAFPAGQTAEINPSVTEIVRALESIGYTNGLATSRVCKVDDVVEAVEAVEAVDDEGI